MIITVKKIPRPFQEWVVAFTAWPFIVIEEAYADDECILAHEKYHLKEQARWLVIPWFIAYFALLPFYGGGRRHPMERGAYAEEGKCRES